MKKPKTISLLVMLMMVFSTIVIVTYTSKSAPTEVNALFTSDWHYGKAGMDTTTGMGDINTNLDLDMFWALGDMQHDGFTTSQWTNWHNAFDALTGTGSIFYKNYTHGNHEGFYYCDDNFIPYDDGQNDYDCPWYNRSRLATGFGTWQDMYNNRSAANYTYQMGNILFIAMGIDQRTGGGYNSITHWLTWLHTTIDTNTDKNIIILEHAYVPQTGAFLAAEQTQIYSILDGSANPVMWISGDTHFVPSVTLLHNCYFINDGTAVNYPDSPGYVGYSGIQLTFTDGSNQAVIKQRNFNTHTWTTPISGYANIPLHTPYDADYGETPAETPIQIITVDGATNGSYIGSTCPQFKWNNTNAIAYWLQVSNTSDYSNIIFNITDINIANYPVDFSSNTTVCIFNLPPAYALTVYQKYYCRVKYLYD